MFRRACWCALSSFLVVAAVAAPGARADPAPTYHPPVDAPVVDPFRPPTRPYGPGNRGLEYGTAPGAVVRVAGDGVVTFAGLVAGSRHVTVLHPDGLRTTYSFLAAVDVVVGQRLHQGDRVGITSGHLHFGARVGDAYLDPAVLFAPSLTVRLIPFDEPTGAGIRGERSAIRQLIGGIGHAARTAAGMAGSGGASAGAWLRGVVDQPVRTGLRSLELVAPGGAALALALDVVEAWERARLVASRPCTAAADAPPTSPGSGRVALLVGGLGSSSTSASIDELDTAGLGYDAGLVLRFSYAGGRVPDPTDRIPAVAATAYGPEDSQADLRRAGARLADLIEQVLAGVPGRPIDLLAHSQGGLVARLALAELERRHGPGWFDRIGVLVTLGTPHGGADLATAVGAIGATPAGSALLDAVGRLGDLALDDDAPAVRQLAETSAVVDELRARPLPPGVRAVSIAARGDLVVPAPRTELRGAPQVVVGLDGVHAHADLPGRPETAREVALALAGMPRRAARWGRRCETSWWAPGSAGPRTRPVPRGGSWPSQRRRSRPEVPIRWPDRRAGH